MTPVPGRRKVYFHILPSGEILPSPRRRKRNKSTKGTMSINRKSPASPLSSPVWRERRPVAVSGNGRDSETWPHSGTLSKGVPAGGVPQLQGKLDFLVFKVSVRNSQRAKQGLPQNTANTRPISDSSGLFSRPSWEEMPLRTRPGLREGHPPGKQGNKAQLRPLLRVGLGDCRGAGRRRSPAQSCWAEMESELLLMGFWAVHV